MRFSEKKNGALLKERKRMWPNAEPKAWKLIITLGTPSQKN